MQRALGREAAFVGGRRVTSQRRPRSTANGALGCCEQAAGECLVAAGISAVGLSGEDDALIGAEVIDAASLGLAGRPTAINVQLLRTLMDAGYVPVISPVGYDTTSGKGGALNVNGDDAAAAIAVALRADELLLIADVEGVRGTQGEVIQFLSIESARDLIASGVAAGGMAAKLESAYTALLGGVDRVRICDLAGLADSERGTFVTQSQGVVS